MDLSWFPPEDAESCLVKVHQSDPLMQNHSDSENVFALTSKLLARKWRKRDMPAYHEIVTHVNALKVTTGVSPSVFPSPAVRLSTHYGQRMVVEDNNGRMTHKE